MTNLALSSTGLLLACGPALLFLAPAQQGHGDAASADPAEIFRARCGMCHAVPDPGYESDRAWLGQVPKTA